VPWETERDLPWCKVYAKFFESLSHAELDVTTLGVGIACLIIANRRGREADGSGWVVVKRGGQPMSWAGIARYAHATIDQVEKALSDLVRVGTMAHREADGAYGFPKLQRWQEDPSTERQRRKRAREAERASGGSGRFDAEPLPGFERDSEREIHGQKIEDQRSDHEEEEDPGRESHAEDHAEGESFELIPPSDGEDHPPDTILVLPCKKSSSGEHRRRRQFPVTKRYVDELRQIFVFIDVSAELVQIERWVKREPSKMKTFDGWPRCIEGWLHRANEQVRQRSGGRPPAGPQTKKPREW
jgi:hypothetical protein